MNIPEKLNNIKQNETKVYEAGKNKWIKDFWTRLQKSGGSMSYMRTFAYNRYNDDTFNPIYPIKGSIYEIFISNEAITDTKVDIIINTTTDSPSRAFYWCRNLKTIRKIKLMVDNITFYSHTFEQCDALENIQFEGNICTNIDFHWSKKLTHDSLINIVNCLKDYSDDTSGATYTCNFGDTNLAKLTDEEKLIATNKGWTLA